MPDHNDDVRHFTPGMVHEMKQATTPEQKKDLLDNHLVEKVPVPDMPLRPSDNDEEIQHRFSMIDSHPIFIHLVHRPKPTDIFSPENFIAALPEGKMLTLYRKVFNSPTPFNLPADQLKENKKTIVSRHDGGADYADVDGKPMTLALYCSMGGALICWENYSDMVASKETLSKFHIASYDKVYIAGTMHPLRSATGHDYQSRINRNGYEMHEIITYLTLK